MEARVGPHRRTLLHLRDAASAPQPSRTCGRAPSTRSTLPLMKLAAGESKNTIAADTSASVPKRPSGTVAGIDRSIGAASSG